MNNLEEFKDVVKHDSMQELIERNKELTEQLEKANKNVDEALNAFINRESHICPLCGTSLKVSGITQDQYVVVDVVMTVMLHMLFL